MGNDFVSSQLSLDALPFASQSPMQAAVHAMKESPDTLEDTAGGTKSEKSA